VSSSLGEELSPEEVLGTGAIMGLKALNSAERSMMFGVESSCVPGVFQPATVLQASLSEPDEVTEPLATFFS
jgi:hypothetical protein